MQAKPCSHPDAPTYRFRGCPCDYPTRITYRISSGGIEPEERFEHWMAFWKNVCILPFSAPMTWDRGLSYVWDGGSSPGRMPFELVTRLPLAERSVAC